jgi:glycosyltransferase involved in cell wall biosynthesis
MKKTKILYWTPEFYPEIDGITELTRKTLPELQNRNYEFLVVTSHGRQRLPDITEFSGIPVHRFHFREILGQRNLSKILMYQKQIAQLKVSFDPDIIHFHFSDPYGYFHVNTATAHHAPTLLTVHMSIAEYDVGTDTLIGNLLHQAAWVTSVSDATLADAKQAVPALSKRSSVIYNGLNFPDITPEPLNFDKPRILCLGRLVADKGFDLAIAAFAHVKNRIPGSRLVIAGDGTARKELEHQTAMLGLSEFVDFPGWIDPDKVPQLINDSTMVVLPSRWREPFALVALHAAQMARPVVAARVGGLPETVIHEQTGLLIEKENVQQLVEAITFLLENPDEAIQYGRTGRKRAGDVFSMEKYINAYDDLYKKLRRRINNNEKWSKSATR